MEKHIEEHIWRYLDNVDAFNIMENVFWLLIIEKFPKIVKFECNLLFSNAT